MINLSIKIRTFLLAFIPMVLITTILSIYFLRSHLDEIDNSIEIRGTSMAKHLANASEFGLFSGNKDILKKLLSHSLQEEGVSSLSITDLNGNIFIKVSRNKDEIVSQPDSHEMIKIFRHPIILFTADTLNPDEFSTFSDQDGHNEILGWLDVSLSTEQIVSKRNLIIWNSTLIILSGLIASILLSLWMGRSFTNPIIRLTQAVHNVENGNLEEVINTRSTGEIGKLEVGFMSMLGKIRSSQKDLQEKINETTLGLQNTLNTVEKQNIELTEARKKALEASETKTRFLANISHEIRTPMNGILGFARLLKKTRLSREQYDYLDTIEKSSDNLLHLLEDILDISRVEEGKLIIKYKPFNLRNCIEDVILLMAPAIHENELDIIYFIDRDIPENISAPFERIRQVLINYIGNAIKFSVTGTIVVHIARNSGENQSLKISVSDQGIGIPDDEKEHIFSPFTQIDDTSTRPHGGTGLGLAISRSIARAMGGDAGLEDNEPSGSTFWFTFPYHETSHTKVLANPASSYSIPVLLYDSNPYTLKGIHTQVTEAGYSVTNYSDINAVIRSSTKNIAKTICILSLSHQEIVDTNTRHYIEDIAKLPNTRLLMLLSTINSSESEAARKCGADACLTKPYRYHDLIRCINNLFPAEEESVSNIDTTESQQESANILDGINILLAEDNIINTKLVKTVLMKSGATLKHASNGQEAIDAYHSGIFDIILMDIQMPKVNGEDATISIRNSGERGLTIPIIGMTANALPEDISRYKNAGFSNVLIKPISVDDLLHEIKHNLEKTVKADTPVSPQSSEINFHNKLGISKQLSDDLYKILINELPQVSEQLQELYSEQDWVSLRKQIHKLLGGISYCNVPELEKRTLTFQSSLRDQSTSINEDFAELINEINSMV